MKNPTNLTYKNERILNIPFTRCSFMDILKDMGVAIQRHQIGGFISITNTESLYHATRIPSHFQYINNANFSCCDGVAVVLAGKILGFEIPRLHGPDLMLTCCDYGISRKWRHFFYGEKRCS